MPRTVTFWTAKCSASSSSDSIRRFACKCSLVKFLFFFYVFFIIYHLYWWTKICNNFARKLRPTDIDAVKRVSNERPFAHVVVFVVDLETTHAADEAARCSSLRRRHADVLEPAQKQLSTERHPTEQALRRTTTVVNTCRLSDVEYKLFSRPYYL